MVIFFEEGVVFHCSLLKLQINAAAIDTDYASDSAFVWRKRDKQKKKLFNNANNKSKYVCFPSHLYDITSIIISAYDSCLRKADSYSTLFVMRVLSFMMAVRAKPLVAGADMCDCKTASKASRTSSSVTLCQRTICEHQ